MADITIPENLLPADGRFGCGPSKVRPEAVATLATEGAEILGTSHRQAPVKNLVGRVREGVSELFSLPEGYQVVLGNGGSTAFWDIAAFGLVREKSQHLSFGEFSSKFAGSAKAAPWLADPSIVKSEPGTHPVAVAEAGVDLYALTAQRDLDRRGHAHRAAGRAPTRARWCWWTRPRGPAACRSTSPRPTSTTSPRRSASPPTAACGSASSRLPLLSGLRRSPRRTATSRRSSACRPRSTTPRRTRRTTPRRWRRCS